MNKKILYALGLSLSLLFIGCGGDSKNNVGQVVEDNPLVESFSSEVRLALAQDEDDEPISPKEFTDEKTNFDSLLD